MDPMARKIGRRRRREWLAAASAALLAGLAVVAAAWEDVGVVEVRVQGSAPAEVSPAASPPSTGTTGDSGRRIVWAENGKVWLYEDETGGRRALTDNGTARWDFLPRFRDPDRVTYLSSDERDTGSALMEVSLATGRSSALTRLRGAVRSYDWSPDGETLAYYGTAAEDEATVLHIVGTGEPYLRPFRPILDRGGFINWDETRVEWSPGGRHLLVIDTALDAAIDDSPATTLHVLNPDGTDAIPPARRSGRPSPAWRWPVCSRTSPGYAPSTTI